MTLALYMDQHVKEAITGGLRQRGIDVLTVREDGFDRHSDADVLARATELGRVVFTQDVDFIALADEWLANGRPFAGIAFAHQLKITIGQAIADLEVVCRVLSADEAANQLIRLPPIAFISPWEGLRGPSTMFARGRGARKPMISSVGTKPRGRTH